MPRICKHLGQNFLVDKTVIRRIIAAIAVSKDDNLFEIGAGKGAITLPILKQVVNLHVIEIDKHLVAILEAFEKNNLIIHQGDILKFNLSIMPIPLRIIGNLPYNITSPILFYLLENINIIKDAVLMLQKEVVMRVIAKSGNKIYGRLSVMMQAFFQVEMLFTVKADAFSPVPKVDSAIVYLKPLSKTLVKDSANFAKIVKASFSQRRKMLKNCLQSLLVQQQTTIDLSQRAEMLSVDDFITLTNDYLNKIHAR